MPLLWTSTPRTLPGWYWWRSEDLSQLRVYEVQAGPCGAIVQVGSVIRQVADVGGWWAGPIEPPAFGD